MKFASFGLSATLAVLVPILVVAQHNPIPKRTICHRLCNRELQQTLLEGLAYLEDNQIRDRLGKGNPLRDSSEMGDGCRGRVSINIPFHENIGVPIGKVQNREGEWACHIHFLPKRLGWKGRTFLGTQDSCLFVTAGVSHGLLFFDDSQLPPQRQFVTAMLSRALTNINQYKRGNAYNFWPLLEGVESPYTRTGPPNIPVARAKRLARFYVNNSDRFFSKLVLRGQRLPPPSWTQAVLDRFENPTGADAFFNVPNDSDDTAMAVALQHAIASRFPSIGVRADTPALMSVSQYRDVMRCKEDGRDGWRGRNTGAFLTWLKNENDPTFANPCGGVIPLGINNVDVVVNANVAYALAKTNQKQVAGYRECLKLLTQAVYQRAWPQAGLYYPQQLMFPYAVSRAYRAGATEENMHDAMKMLMAQLLEMQEQRERRPQIVRYSCSPKGAFSGGDDESYHFSTALGLCALINLGRPMACEIGQANRFDRAVQDAAHFLIKARKKLPIHYRSTRCALGPCCSSTATWDSGLFFGGPTDIATWRSQAITVSATIEALGKYALGCDIQPELQPNLALQIRPINQNGFYFQPILRPN